jgi:DDE superfamily endonuclease
MELIYCCLRYSVLPALSLEEGVLHCDIIEGSFNTASFYKFIEHTLDHMQPFPASNSVIVMDNCHIHKHIDIQNLIESR